MTQKCKVLFLLWVILTIESSHPSSAQANPSRPLPNVVILATGGTIAGAASTSTQASYTSGAGDHRCDACCRPRNQGSRQHQG